MNIDIGRHPYLFALAVTAALWALALRLGSIWPLVAYHAAHNVPHQIIADPASGDVAASPGLTWLAALVGVWLLWTDRTPAGRLEPDAPIVDSDPAD
jgi:hypothetical protein